MTLFENLLPDHFEVLGELGRGGAGVVYHAKDLNRNQEVAVKVLLKDTEEDRFQREAERLAALSHPNVVAFLEVGRHDGRDYLVMEYLEMGELFSYVQNLSVIEILRLFCQICDGLAHLHDRGIVHRDIKPANILVSKSGVPKITDLGVARQMERNTRLTQAGTILGTYSYLAPEQILSSSVGPRADIYSLGICLFTSLTGRKPFEADNEFKMLKAHLEEEPPSLLEYLPNAPKSLDDLVQHMLAKDEEDRPRSGRAVADMLQDCIREMEDEHQEDMQPAWDEQIEELSDDVRSVLLAVSYLGDEATFENVCKAAPFSEDKIDRCLEALLADKLIDSPASDRFKLSFPEETIQTRLTPRIKKLFSSRLTDLSESRERSIQRELASKTESSVDVVVLPPVEKPNTKNDPATNELPKAEPVPPPIVEPSKPASEAAATVTASTIAEAPKPTPKPEPETKTETPAKAPPAQVEFVAAKTTKTKEPAKTVKPKSRSILVSVIMMLTGVLCAAGGYWYWAHSVSMKITSEPTGATVLVNGLEVGVTPIDINKLQPGSHAVALELDGHKEAKEVVELGFMAKQDLHFPLEPMIGKLLLTLKPSDASVTIDGREYGVVNSALTLAEGEHRLKVEKVGFQTTESEVVLVEDQPLELEVALTPIVTTVKIESLPPGASVTLDGNDKGKTPVTLEKVKFGEHDLAVRMKGHDRFNQTVEVKNAEPIAIKATLTELPGGLMVTSEPAGAKIKLNGEIKGETPKTLTGLKAGQYTLTLSKDGYHVKQEKKAIIAGEETKAHYALSAIVVAPPVSPPPVYRPQPRPYNPPPTYRPQPRPPAPRPSQNPWDPI